MSARAHAAATPLVLSLLICAPALGAESRLPAVADEPVAEADILAVDHPMRAFLAEQLKGARDPNRQLHALLDALFSKKGLDIQYDGSHRTLIAAETFASRSGNCLSFTNLFVALAREVGLKAYFMEVADVLDRDRRGEVLVSNKHMFAMVEIGNGHFPVDFSRGAPPDYHRVWRISDRRAAAHYYNNVGVEKLVGGEPGEAIAFLERALANDSGFAPAWINLGVARRMVDQFEAAEGAYRKAIEIDRSELAAFANLAYLYRAWGRTEEAEALFSKVSSYRKRNPFHHLSRGRRAVEAGELEEAVRHFRQALRWGPDEAELHFALGDAYYRLGDRDKAAVSLRQAARLADSDSQREHYERALNALTTLP